MRTVAAVIALVACVHAGLWALAQDHAERSQLRQASSPAFPMRRSTARPIPMPATQAQRRANSRRPQDAGAADARDPHLFVDRRRRAGAPHRRRIRAEGHGRRLDRQERGPQRARNRARRSTSPSATATSTASSSATKPSTAASRRSSDLIELIQRVKRSTNVPVTTGEIWHVWLEHPELVSSVDFIAAHILPYWEGFSDKQAVDQAILIYDKLRAGLSRQAHRHRRVRLAERRLQSARTPIPAASSRPSCCATSSRAPRPIGIDYNIVEAIDQPWKIFEGGVGPYWGMFDAARAAEIRLDRPDRQSRSLEARRHRRAGRRPAVAADPGDERG